MASCLVVHRASAIGAPRLGGSLVDRWPIYDALLHTGKPTSSMLGLQPMTMVYEGALWKGGDIQIALPRAERIALEATRAATLGHPVVLDIERFPIRTNAGVNTASIDILVNIVNTFRSANNNNSSIGLYGVPPIRDYWRAIKGPVNVKYKDWQAENNRLVPLANVVDVFYPSLYTFYRDLPGWKTYAAAQIAECRRLDERKKVVPFIWYRFHDSNAELRGQEISAPMISMQLEFLRPLCDGVVLWGGWQEAWVDEAAWWKVITKFMRNLT